MELKGTQHINSSRAAVWAALNDPEILQQCIPGCESFTRESDTTYALVITATVGPVKAKFTGRLILSDIRHEEGYTLSFEGSGGVAGFGKGSAHVLLATADGGTTLTYEANARVGGKLAQAGARLIDSVAAKMADEFFSRFRSAMESTTDEATAGEAATESTSVPDSRAAEAARDGDTLVRPTPSGSPLVITGEIGVRLNWPKQVGQPRQPVPVVLPVLSIPSVVLLVAVAVASFLLGRLG